MKNLHFIGEISICKYVIISRISPNISSGAEYKNKSVCGEKEVFDQRLPELTCNIY